jgi:hypothetical protein
MANVHNRVSNGILILIAILIADRIQQALSQQQQVKSHTKEEVNRPLLIVLCVGLGTPLLTLIVLIIVYVIIARRAMKRRRRKEEEENNQHILLVDTIISDDPILSERRKRHLSIILPTVYTDNLMESQNIIENGIIGVSLIPQINDGIESVGVELFEQQIVATCTDDIADEETLYQRYLTIERRSFYYSFDSVYNEDLELLVDTSSIT